MISTVKVSSPTSLTVSDTPSRATEPLDDETGKLRGCIKGQSRHVGQILTRNHRREAVGVAGNDVAAEFVPHLERALEINAVPRRQARPWSLAGSPQQHPRRTMARLPSFPRPTTVKQTPLQAIDAPIAIVSGS
jgi:hypothetical protein